ncbi:MAG: hypothetical protein BWZ00_00917 [Bacteroidetes bacterium ADurb.BinA174]|jgi:hypothetical protein|nr:MAG: hypothetical protein BWZ00_00917 [Bacteroidetes bacterium ADurb.BinA174]
MATIKHFEDLEIWKDARILCKQIRYLLLKDESFAKDFTLRNQISGSSGPLWIILPKVLEEREIKSL